MLSFAFDIADCHEEREREMAGGNAGYLFNRSSQLDTTPLQRFPTRCRDLPLNCSRVVDALSRDVGRILFSGLLPALITSEDAKSATYP
jgi:hypothetical protein